MANDLTNSEQNLLSAINKNDISTLIKPLINEIHLFDSFIAGTSYVNQELFEKLKAGEDLILQREDNKFDSNAIMIMTADKQKLGYVPERDNVIFARLLDAGKCLKAKVINVTRKGTYNKVSIGIYLIDF